MTATMEISRGFRIAQQNFFFKKSQLVSENTDNHTESQGIQSHPHPSSWSFPPSFFIA